MLLLVSLAVALSLGYFSGKKLDSNALQSGSIEVPESLALLPLERLSPAEAESPTAATTGKVLGRLGSIESVHSYPLADVFTAAHWFPSSSILDREALLTGEYLQSFFFRKSLANGFLLKSMELRLDLSKPHGFVEFSFGGNKAGAHVLRVMKDRVALLYSVLHESRVVIQELLLTEHLGTGPLGISIGNDSLTLRYYEKPIYSFSEKGIAAGSFSIATNLNEKDFISLVVGSIFEGKETKDICF